MSDEHMWLVPFTEGQNHTVTITFPQETLVSGLRLWNYNKSPEDTYRGVRIIKLTVPINSSSGCGLSTNLGKARHGIPLSLKVIEGVPVFVSN